MDCKTLAFHAPFDCCSIFFRSAIKAEPVHAGLRRLPALPVAGRIIIGCIKTDPYSAACINHRCPEKSMYGLYQSRIPAMMHAKLHITLMCSMISFNRLIAVFPPPFVPVIYVFRSESCAVHLPVRPCAVCGPVCFRNPPLPAAAGALPEASVL